MRKSENGNARSEWADGTIGVQLLLRGVAGIAMGDVDHAGRSWWSSGGKGNNGVGCHVLNRHTFIDVLLHA